MKIGFFSCESGYSKNPGSESVTITVVSFMNKNDLYQTLLQLALSTGGDPESPDYDLTALFNSSIPVFTDRLECSGAYVLQRTGDSLQLLYCSSPAGKSGFPLAHEVESLYREIEESGKVEKCHIISRELVYHIFCLKNFGLLILSRETQLDDEFLDRLPPVINSLANTCRFYLIGRKNVVRQAGTAESVNFDKATFQAPQTHSLKGIRVLLAEDNRLNQLIAQVILEKWGAACMIAGDGQQAIDLVAGEKFDLILMDIQMPVMDGITASTYIRKNLKLQTPILALTAGVVEGVMEPFEKAGMQGYISKPFEEEELYAKIKSVLALPVEDDGAKPGAEEQIHLCDVSRLTKLVGNDAASLKKMIEKFLEVTPAYVSELSEASDHHDLEAISRTSHKMKSSIDLVSNDTMRNLIQTINDISASGTGNEELFDLIQRFLKYFPWLAQQLKEFV